MYIFASERSRRNNLYFYRKVLDVTLKLLPTTLHACDLWFGWIPDILKCLIIIILKDISRYSNHSGTTVTAVNTAWPTPLETTLYATGDSGRRIVIIHYPGRRRNESWYDRPSASGIPFRAAAPPCTSASGPPTCGPPAINALTSSPQLGL